MKQNAETRMFQRLFRTLYPVQALAMGLPAVNTLIDSIVAGNYIGEDALATTGFAGPLTIFISVIGTFLCLGAQMNCSRCLGKGDKEGLNGVFTLTLLLGFGIGLIFSLVMMLMPDTLAYLLGASGDVGIMTSQYMQSMGIGAMATVLSASLMIFLQMEQLKAVQMVCTVLTVVINVGGNLLNALVLDYGMYGFGLFTSLGTIASVLVALVTLGVRGKLFRFHIKYIRRGMLRPMMREGLPYLCQRICIVFRDRIMNQYVFMLGGTLGIAAMTVAYNVTNSVGVVIQSGSSSAGKSIAGVLTGHQDRFTLQRLPKIMVRSTAFVYAFNYALVFVFARQLAWLMGVDDVNMGFYINAIRLVNLWYLFDIIVEPFECVYQAMEKYGLLVLVNFLCQLVVCALVCQLSMITVGIDGIYVFTALSLVVETLIFLVYYICRAKRIPKSPLHAIYLPDDFGVHPEKQYRALITSVDTAEQASCGIYDFCMKSGTTEHVAYITSLCMEEIGMDAVNNRFTKKESIMDCQAICEGDNVSLMIRDDCPSFDPKAWLELCVPEEAERSVGIRLVMDLAKDVNYVNTLGLNVLMIKL